MQKPLEILTKYWGYTSFRSSQEKIIDSVLEGKDVIALLPTGGGKSVCYQVPTMLREGICIVVSPLIALMKDQVESLLRRGIKALDLSGNLSYNDLERILDNCHFGNYKFIYLSPERLQNELVAVRLQAMNISLIAIDEAHCISHWGKGFRPAYLQCHLLREWFPSVPILALTATATTQVIQDIQEELHLEKAEVIRTSLQRPNLAYMVYPTEDKYSYLLRILQKNKKSSIVYLNSRKGVQNMAEYLENRGVSATFFHGGLSFEDKNYRLGMWLTDDVQVMVATNAFGMGIDKPDVQTVIHWEIPQSIEDYFQEVGRAGRNGQKSFGVLLYDKRDFQNFQLKMEQSVLDMNFLKFLYRRLNQYFQISYAEGQDMRYDFRLLDFCNRYKIPTKQAYEGLSVLENAGILEKIESYYRKAEVMMKISPNKILDFLRREPRYNDVLHYLIRTYTMIYHEMTPVRIDKTANFLKVSQQKVILYLEELEQRQVIDYKEQSSDMQITFRVPRDDDRTINSHSKNIKLYQQIKEQQYRSMFDYLQNEKECRSVQLLRYFDEKINEPCGICSYCIEQKGKKSLSELEELSEKIISRLAENPSDVQELMYYFSTLKENIIQAIDMLLEDEKIELQNNNKYKIKK